MEISREGHPGGVQWINATQQTKCVVVWHCPQDGIIVFRTVDNLTLDDFDRMVALNVRGAFAATQVALRHMGDGGRIINFSSYRGSAD